MATTLMRLKRIELGLTQSQLSKISDVEQHRISLLERGFAQPTPQEAQALAKALEIPAEDLQKPGKVIKE